jgi:isoquinoline 1-oxidoreductase beta subunit
MLYGALKMPPTVTGKVTGIRNADAVKAMPGIKAVVQAPDAAIVVATSYWLAKKGADADRRRSGRGEGAGQRQHHGRAQGGARGVGSGRSNAPGRCRPGAGRRRAAGRGRLSHAVYRARDDGIGERHGTCARRCHRSVGADPGQDFVRNALGKLYGRKPRP